MGMLDFLKDDPDDELDEELDDELDDEFDDDELLDKETEKSSKGGLLGFFKKSDKEEEPEDMKDEDDAYDDTADIGYSGGRHSFSSNYKASLIRQSQQARNSLERRTRAALDEIRRIAGQAPVAGTAPIVGISADTETDEEAIEE